VENVPLIEHVTGEHKLHSELVLTQRGHHEEMLLAE
jgi:hypothetical protein